jgi:NAD(P)-dependent dehydrogenase (short-subunit alcohol dehydrogenase family)
VSQTARFTTKLTHQKVLLIGATGGTGIAMAQGLVEFGAIIFLSSSREAKVNECVQSILSDYPFAKGRVFGCPCDLSSQQVETNLEQLLEKVGNVNHVVFMAGERLPTVPLEEINLERCRRPSASAHSPRCSQLKSARDI